MNSTTTTAQGDISLTLAEGNSWSDLDTMEGSSPESPTHISPRSAHSKVLLECYDALAAQKRKLEAIEPVSASIDFRGLNKMLDDVIEVVEALQLDVEEGAELEKELVHLIMGMREMKKENTFLRRSLQKNQSPRQSAWNGFRDSVNAPSDGSDQSEEPSIPTDEGSKMSGYSQHSLAHPAEPPFDGVVRELERCRIVSRPASPVGHRGQEPSQDSFLQTAPSTVSSTGSASSQEFMTDSQAANLQGNRVDFIFAVDRQKMSAQLDSEALTTTSGEYSFQMSPLDGPDQSPVTHFQKLHRTRHDEMERAPESQEALNVNDTMRSFPSIVTEQDSTTETSDIPSVPCTVLTKAPVYAPEDDGYTSAPPPPAEDFQYLRDDLEIGEVLVALGTLGLFFSVLYIYSLYKETLVDGFFEHDSRELDYYKRVYYGW